MPILPPNTNIRIGTVKAVIFVGTAKEDLSAFPKSAKERAGHAFRVIYTATFRSAIYVLHAFQKKTRATARKDIDLAKRRYREAAALENR